MTKPKRNEATPAKTAVWKPGAAPLEGQVLEFIDEDGRIRWPFGGDNMFGRGFFLDLNKDGVMERVDCTNYGIKVPGGEPVNVSGVTISTATIPSKTLLEVIHNFHPSDKAEANKWTHSISDRDGDGIYELDIGPPGNERLGAPLETPKAVFKWDQAKGHYVGPMGGQGKHWQVPDPEKWGDGFWKYLTALGKKGGLNYPLRDEPENEIVKKDENEDEVLKVRELPTLVEFPKWVEPPKLREMKPRDAALAMAEANRTDAHRKLFSLIAENGGAPETGSIVMLYEVGWGQPHWDGFRFGTGGESESVYHVSDVLKQGGPLKWTRGTLSAKDAKWIGQTIWWLDQVRTVLKVAGTTVPESPRPMFEDVTLGQLSFASDQSNFQSPKTVGFSLSEQWAGRYDREVAQSLTMGLWKKFIGADLDIWEKDGGGFDSTRPRGVGIRRIL